MTYIESNLAFSFDDPTIIKHIEERELGYGLKNTDFVIREDKEIVLLEVKGTSSDAEKYLSDDLISKLVEKARDTYTFLHLLQDTALPLTFVALIDFRSKGIDSALLVRKDEALKSGLKGEKGHTWNVEYIKKAYLLDLNKFQTTFKEYPVVRQP